MSSNTQVLKCGEMITVRSNKAESRLAAAKGLEVSLKSKYTFKGLEADSLFLFDKEFNLKMDDGDDLAVNIDDGAAFFDQTPYMVSIWLPDAIDAYLFTPLASWVDSSDWDSGTKRLSVPLNFGNDLGDFELCWEWLDNEGERHQGSMSAQVFSFKLDIHSHFKWMLDEVMERFEWLQLDLLRQTTWGWGHDNNAEASLKTWLLIFQKVRSDMEEGFVRLTKRHRRRLISETRQLRVEKMKRIPSRLEERIVDGIKDNPNRRYPVEKKILDANTPENRYMKHILYQTHAELSSVIDRIELVERISDVFKERLLEWADDLARLKQHHFWKGVGSFHGLRKESLILSQDPLYASVRRSWYFLQQGLSFLDQDLRGGIQNAAQLYEVWCLVKMSELIEKNGWQCESDKGINFARNKDEFSSDEIGTGAVKFIYKKEGIENIQLDLLFQPTASSKPERKGIWVGMMAQPVVQKPDIVLRLHRNDLPNKPIYTWIFDAKYRLHNKMLNNAPDDAVNQMHRYRDAILWSNPAYGEPSLMRESIGAFVLYPGAEVEGVTYPQINSIDKTNIGAFPLRPTAPINEEKESDSTLENKLGEFLKINTDPCVMERGDEKLTSVPTLKSY